MERNVMTSFRILSSFQCFFSLFSNKSKYNKIQLTENGDTYFSNNTTFKIILNTLTFIHILRLFLFNHV